MTGVLPIHVRQMQNVKMALIHILASARKELMVMEFLVQVIRIINCISERTKLIWPSICFSWNTMLNNNNNVLFFLKHVQLQNVKHYSTSNLCDTNAKCDNYLGSYICECKEGFSDDGTSCIGNLSPSINNRW